MIRRAVSALALHCGWERLFLRMGPSPDAYAEFMRRHGGLYSLGANVGIVTGTRIHGRELVSIGNNVLLAGCALLSRDDSVEVLNRAYGICVEKAGKIEIRDNVFVGNGAIVLDGVTVGPNAIVAAGAVVTRDVAPDTVVAGIPAQTIGRVSELAGRLQQRTADLPWSHLIEIRDGAYDATVEPELRRLRRAFFFGEVNQHESRQNAIS